MFGKIKDMYKLQKQAKKIQKELKKIHVEAEEGGVIVTVSAEQQLVSVNIPEELMSPDNKKKVEKYIIIAATKATKKAQQISQERMKDVMGDMGLPGMG